MTILWDPEKARVNLLKHGVSFYEAVTGLNDPLALTNTDPDHSIGEERFLTFGLSAQGRLLVISHTDENGIIRIVSARVATKKERNIYEEG